MQAELKVGQCYFPGLTHPKRPLRFPDSSLPRSAKYKDRQTRHLTQRTLRCGPAELIRTLIFGKDEAANRAWVSLQPRRRLYCLISKETHSIFSFLITGPASVSHPPLLSLHCAGASSTLQRICPISSAIIHQVSKPKLCLCIAHHFLICPQLSPVPGY